MSERLCRYIELREVLNRGKRDMREYSKGIAAQVGEAELEFK